jgi:NodT family efflux transporter outer membrane factor (OMF) lipoprotein
VYEVDLWGRVRSRVEAERFRAKATRTDYQTAALSLSAEVVRTWTQLAEANSQRRLVQEQIETNETVLTLLENRFETGQIRSVDVLRQRQLVESTREQRAVVESRIQVLEHRLAVLLGRPPQAGIDDPPEALPELPPLPAAGVPTDLIRRRPDVQRALNRLKAADRDLATAISNQYPRLTLSVSASTAASTAQDLFQSWAYAFAGDLLAPIFRGGALRAEVDRTEAVRIQRLYAYGQTILTAFQEVEDALIREKKQREQIQQLERQVELAQQAYEQLRTQYFNGAADYLDVLTALDEVQQLRRDRLAAERTLVEDRIALYRALAGAFETERARNS